MKGIEYNNRLQLVKAKLKKLLLLVSTLQLKALLLTS